MLEDKIRKLQEKPYHIRVRLLWTALGVTAVILIALWLLTLRFRQSETVGRSETATREIWNTLKKVKDIKLK